MSDPSSPQIVRDPTLPEPELEGQASAKTGTAWRFSYRACGSAEPWRAVEASDPQLDDLLRRAGYRRVAVEAPGPSAPVPSSRPSGRSMGGA